MQRKLKRAEENDSSLKYADCTSSATPLWRLNGKQGGGGGGEEGVKLPKKKIMQRKLKRAEENDSSLKYADCTSSATPLWRLNGKQGGGGGGGRCKAPEKRR